jgi:hypothetical protein
VQEENLYVESSVEAKFKKIIFQAFTAKANQNLIEDRSTYWFVSKIVPKSLVMVESLEPRQLFSVKIQ